jgi:cation diffusion facilitator CzcD-associated flavoprotein CzcO
VDTESPLYQLYDEELWRDFTFKERYSGHRELRQYFEYVVKKWDLQKDIVFNKAVEDAEFDQESARWQTCADGSRTFARWFIPCLGFAAKRFTPPTKGVSDFAGEVFHTGAWPAWGANLTNKSVAIIGTG